MFKTLGFGGTGGVMAAVVAVFGTVPVLLVHFTNIGVGARYTTQSRSTTTAIDGDRDGTGKASLPLN